MAPTVFHWRYFTGAGARTAAMGTWLANARLTEPILLCWAVHRARWRSPMARSPPPWVWVCNSGIPGVAPWIVGHSLAVWGARVDPQFMQVLAKHLKHKPLLDV
jgi:hypothetical protein